MVLNYDRDPNRSIEEKLNTLVMNLQLAFNEVEDKLDRIEKKLEKMQNEIDSIGT